MLTPDAFSPAGFCVDEPRSISLLKKSAAILIYLKNKSRTGAECTGSNSLSQTANAKSWHFVSHGEMWVPMPGDAAAFG